MRFYASTARALLLLALAALAAAPAAVRALPLPLAFRALEARVPPGAPRAALASLLGGLPAEICRLGPANYSALPVAFKDQVRARGAQSCAG